VLTDTARAQSPPVGAGIDVPSDAATDAATDAAADVAADVAADAAADVAAGAACVVARNNALTGIAELAEGDESFLVLDAEAGNITMALHAVPLRIFPVLAVEAATGHEATRNLWKTHRGGVFTPARIENPPEELPVSLEGETEEIVQIHLPPAQRFPAPARFRVSFADGLAVDFHSGDGAGEVDGGLSARIASWFGDDAAGKPALRIRMDATEAGDLYRALPSGVALVIEPDCS
jgi:hypothetical protein